MVSGPTELKSSSPFLRCSRNDKAEATAIAPLINAMQHVVTGTLVTARLPVACELVIVEHLARHLLSVVGAWSSLMLGGC